MKRTPNTGDRCKVKRGEHKGKIGKVAQVDPDDDLDVKLEFESGDHGFYSHEVLIRIVPTKKRREFWIEPCAGLLGNSNCINVKVSSYPREDYIHVKECNGGRDTTRAANAKE